MRISRHQMFMEIARVVSKRSTCLRLNVGAVVVLDNRVVSIGYCGPIKGAPHCTECEVEEDGGCGKSIHAEINALRFIPKSVRGPCSLYVTNSPCLHCANTILTEREIVRVFYESVYRSEVGIYTLIDSGMKVFRVRPNGIISDHSTGKIVELK